jgi:hypothetical protein
MWRAWKVYRGSWRGRGTRWPTRRWWCASRTSRLPEPERTATALFYVGDYSQAEVAGFLDLPVTTVNNRLHAARKRLHRSMMSMVRDHLQEGRPSAEHETLTGTVVRPTYLRNKHPGNGKGYLWRNLDGSLRGYVVANPTHQWRSPDLGRLNHGGYRDLLWHDESAGDVAERLRVLGHLARETGCRELAFDRLHRLSPLGKRLRRMRCRIEEEYRSYVVRVIRLRSLFDKLAPELWRRLAASPLAGWRGTLLVASGDQHVRLRVDPSGIRVDGDSTTGGAAGAAADASVNAIEGDGEIAQLVVGSDEPGQIVEAAGMSVRGEAGRLLPVLFPAQYPQMENQAL